MPNLVIPSYITKIGDKAFGNTKVVNLIFDNTQTGSSVYSALNSVVPFCFIDCVLLESITFGSHIVNIENYAFKGCISLKSVTLGQNIDTLGPYSFYGCSNLTTVVIPANSKLKNIEGYSFSETALKSFDIDPSSDFFFTNGALLNGAKDTLLYFIPSPDVKSYIVPGNIKTIGQYAFMGAKHLLEVIISDGNFKTVGFKAFAECTNLRRLVFPGSLTEIQDDAFLECNKILCGGLFLPDKLSNKAHEEGMPLMPLSFGCLNNFDALLKKQTCNLERHKMNVGAFFSLLLGKDNKKLLI